MLLLRDRGTRSKPGDACELGVKSTETYEERKIVPQWLEKEGEETSPVCQLWLPVERSGPYETPFPQLVYTLSTKAC